MMNSANVAPRDTFADGEVEATRETDLKDDEYKACVFDELKLDERSEKAIELLEQDEQCVLLMPAIELVLAHGPERTVLYWLCRDVEMTMKINDFLEGKRRDGRLWS